MDSKNTIFIWQFQLDCPKGSVWLSKRTILYLQNYFTRAGLCFKATGNPVMKNTIFILEDNEDICYVLDYFLTEKGFDVKIFPNITSFYETFKNELPDLFLLDVMLPDGDGLLLCKEIRNDERSGMIPILMMSAHSASENVFSESCADGFIAKPFDLLEVSAKVSSYLNRLP